MEIKVATFNLRMPYHGDGINYFFNRSPYILKKIQEEMPDVIGFQEAKEEIYDWLKATLSDYFFVGIGREKDFSDEANPIAFRKDKFELFSFNQFWLSPTPEIPGSRHKEQSICPRICTAAKLKVKGSTTVFRFYNTHLDHVGAGARLLGMQSILDYIVYEKDKNPLPIILTGDMNATPAEPSIALVKEFSSLALCDVSASVTHTFHGFHGGSAYAEGEKIDYIFTNLPCVKDSCKAWESSSNGIYLSDHYPIQATLII